MKNFTFLLVCFMTSLFTHAQWTTDTAVNTLVATSNSDDIQSMTAPNGDTYIVFWKTVPAPTNYELRMQKLDALGNQIFGTDGVLISNTIPMGTFSSQWFMSMDTDQNIYVGVTGTSGEGGYAFKVDSDGNNQWTSDGIDLGGVGYVVRVLPLSSGEAIISWMDGTFTGHIQKFDSDGAPVWASDVNLGSGKIPAQSYELSDGSFINIYHQRLGSFGTNTKMLAQRYDTDGVPQWTNPTQLFSDGNITVFNSNYSGLQDGDVIYMSYKLNRSNRFDSYVQRIDADGSLPWGAMGMDFDTNQTAFEQETQIAFAPGSDYIYALCRYTSTGQGDVGTHIQKFDKLTGERQFTDTSKAVYPLDGTDGGIAPTGNFRLFNGQPVFINVIGQDLNITLLDANGDFVWEEESKPLATYAATKGDVNLNILSESELVATFVEDKGAGLQIFAQNFTDAALSVDEVGTNANLQFINPIQDALIVKSQHIITSVDIYNTLGQHVGAHNTNTNEVNVNAQQWSKGMYLAIVTTANGTTQSIKILKN